MQKNILFLPKRISKYSSTAIKIDVCRNLLNLFSEFLLYLNVTVKLKIALIRQHHTTIYRQAIADKNRLGFVV